MPDRRPGADGGLMAVTEAKSLAAEIHNVRGQVQIIASKTAALEARQDRTEATGQRTEVLLERTAEALERSQSEQHETNQKLNQLLQHRLREEGAEEERKKARARAEAEEAERRAELKSRLAAMDEKIKSKADAVVVAEQAKTLQSVRDWSLRAGVGLSIAGTVAVMVLGWAVSDLLERASTPAQVQGGSGDHDDQ
jgi:glutamate synthase domain-containing protein 2